MIDFFPNWGGGTTAQRAALQAIKALNPNIVIVDYVILESIYNTNTGVQFARDKLDAEQWWLEHDRRQPSKNRRWGQHFIHQSHQSRASGHQRVPLEHVVPG